MRVKQYLLIVIFFLCFFNTSVQAAGGGPDNEWNRQEKKDEIAIKLRELFNDNSITVVDISKLVGDFREFKKYKLIGIEIQSKSKTPLNSFSSESNKDTVESSGLFSYNYKSGEIQYLDPESNNFEMILWDETSGDPTTLKAEELADAITLFKCQPSCGVIVNNFRESWESSDNNIEIFRKEVSPPKWQNDHEAIIFYVQSGSRQDTLKKIIATVDKVNKKISIKEDSLMTFYDKARVN